MLALALENIEVAQGGLNGWEDLLKAAIPAVSSIITSKQNQNTARESQERELELARLQKEAAQANRDAMLAQQQQKTAPPPPAASPDNTALYVVGGVVGVAVIGGLAWYALS